MISNFYGLNNILLNEKRLKTRTISTPYDVLIPKYSRQILHSDGRNCNRNICSKINSQKLEYKIVKVLFNYLGSYNLLRGL